MFKVDMVTFPNHIESKLGGVEKGVAIAQPQVPLNRSKTKWNKLEPWNMALMAAGA